MGNLVPEFVVLRPQVVDLASQSVALGLQVLFFLNGVLLRLSELLSKGVDLLLLAFARVVRQLDVLGSLLEDSLLGTNFSHFLFPHLLHVVLHLLALGVEFALVDFEFTLLALQLGLLQLHLAHFLVMVLNHRFHLLHLLVEHPLLTFRERARRLLFLLLLLLP